MTEDEYIERIHRCIQQAVQRAGGKWKQGFKDETMQILLLIEHAYKEGLMDAEEAYGVGPAMAALPEIQAYNAEKLEELRAAHVASLTDERDHLTPVTEHPEYTCYECLDANIEELIAERDRLRAALEKMVRGWKFANLSEADFIEACELSKADLSAPEEK